MMKKICYVFLFLFGVINMNGMETNSPQQQVQDNIIGLDTGTKFQDLVKENGNPQVGSCPYCGQTVRTIVEEKLDCKSFFCCIATLGIGWGIRKAIKYPDGAWISKATHTCPNCTKVVGIYDPWE